MVLGAALVGYGLLKRKPNGTPPVTEEYLDLPTTVVEATPGFQPPNPFENWGTNPDDYTNVITIPENAPQTLSNEFGNFIGIGLQ